MNRPLYPSEVSAIHTFIVFVIVFWVGALFYIFGSGPVNGALYPALRIGWVWVVRPLLWAAVFFYVFFIFF